MLTYDEDRVRSCCEVLLIFHNPSASHCDRPPIRIWTLSTPKCQPSSKRYIDLEVILTSSPLQLVEFLHHGNTNIRNIGAVHAPNAEKNS